MVRRVGETQLAGLIVCGKCGHHMNTRYPGDKKPCYQCNEFYSRAVAELIEPCGRIAALTLDDLVVREVLRALEPAALELSLRAIEDAERDRKRLHDQWHQRLERVRQQATRAERQYQLAEPENRLVARTLEARWEDALKHQRQEEEEYDRFLARQSATLSPAERQRIRMLSENVVQLWNAEGTSAVDRKQIIRCVVERVILVADRTTELNAVTIVWQGGMETKHQVAAARREFRAVEGLSEADGTNPRPACCGAPSLRNRRSAEPRGILPSPPPGRLYQRLHRGLDPPIGTYRRTVSQKPVGAERVVDCRSRARTRGHRSEDSLLGQAGVDSSSPHAVGQALDCLGRPGRVTTFTQACRQEISLVRGETH